MSQAARAAARCLPALDPLAHQAGVLAVFLGNGRVAVWPKRSRHLTDGNLPVLSVTAEALEALGSQCLDEGVLIFRLYLTGTIFDPILARTESRVRVDGNPAGLVGVFLRQSNNGRRG